MPAIDIATLLDETKCYACYGMTLQQLVQLGLLSRIASGGSSSGSGGWPMVFSTQTTTSVDDPTMTDVQGLSFAVVAGTYAFRAVIAYIPNAAATGARFTLTGPAFSVLNMVTRTPVSASAATIINAGGAFQPPSAATVGSSATGNIAEQIGIVTFSAAGTLKMQCTNEAGIGGSVIVQIGSFIEYKFLV